MPLNQNKLYTKIGIKKMIIFQFILKENKKKCKKVNVK